MLEINLINYIIDLIHCFSAVMNNYGKLHYDIMNNISIDLDLTYSILIVLFPLPVSPY